MTLMLDDSQRRAVELLRAGQFALMTGPPGSGKTTTLCAVLDACDADRLTYRLAAPTGKAARRMAQVTGRDASTIHRLLVWTREGFIHNASNPLHADVVFIDEASMIDYDLALALMAGTSASRLVLIGDADQLPPVGAGRLFGDLCESGAVPVARLTTQHRAAEGSWVARNAPLVVRGDMPDLVDCAGFQRVEVDLASDIVDAILGIVGRDMRAVVLAPQYAGPAGCDALNAKLDGLLNEVSRAPAPGEPRVGDLVRVGMRVIQTANSYSLDVMNGELGVVESIEGDAGPVDVKFDDLGRVVTYSRSEAAQLQPAYCLTVHKVQGSEFGHVVFVCHSTHTRMLSRDLLYTAITRARQRVTLVGDDVGLERALKTCAGKRDTSLVERLRGTLEGIEQGDA